MKTMGRSCRTLFGPLAGWLRYGIERFVVLPAADVLPRRWALFVADAAGFLDAALPSTTSTIGLREAGASTGTRGWRRYAAAGRRLGGSRRDLVMMRRLRRHREHPRDWKIVEVNPERIHALMESRGSCVLVTGHFHHAAELAVGNGLFPPIAGKGMTAPTPGGRLSPQIMRERLQNRLLYGLGPMLEGAPGKQTFPPVGDPEMMPAILKDLSGPGGCVRVFIDAIWDKPRAHRRPFAGIGERGFALGAARIARLAQCPIILEVCVYQPDGAVRVEWGPYIEPLPIDDDAADVAVMDQLLDALEIAVGRYSKQYLHPIGSERTWNAETDCWEAHPAPHTAAIDPGMIAHRV